MSNNIHVSVSKIKNESDKGFQIDTQGLQTCNAFIAHKNQQIEYLSYENQIRKHEIEILKQNAQRDSNKLMLLERTITEGRKQNKERSDLVLESKIADLKKEKDILMNYTKEIKKQYPCIICFEEERNTRVLPCNHVVTCRKCTADIMRTNEKCPVCATDIRTIIWL